MSCSGRISKRFRMASRMRSASSCHNAMASKVINTTCFRSRIGLKKQRSGEKRPVYALRNIMSRASPEPGIYAVRRCNNRARKTDAAAKLRMRKAVYRRFCAHEVCLYCRNAGERGGRARRGHGDRHCQEITNSCKDPDRPMRVADQQERRHRRPQRHSTGGHHDAGERRTALRIACGEQAHLIRQPVEPGKSNEAARGCKCNGS